MTETRDIFYIGNPKDIPELTRILTGLFNRIANRLDQMEGLRGTPTFYKDIFKFITAAGLTSGNVFRAIGTQTAQMGDIEVSDLPMVTHEKGGLEADVSAYNGIPKISGGATSEVSITATGEDLLDGLVNIYDEDVRLIHQFHVENVPYLGEVTNFLREDIEIWNETHIMVGDILLNITGTNPGTYLGYGTWECIGSGIFTLT